MIEKGVGACNYYALRKILEFHKFLVKSGAYYSFSKVLCDTFGLPEKKMFKDGIDEILKDKMGQFVAFLKEAGCYSIVSPDKVTREEGAIVLGIVSILTYGLKKGIERLEAANCENHSLSNFEVLVHTAAEEKYISEADINKVLKFQKDPSDESWMNA